MTEDTDLNLVAIGEQLAHIDETLEAMHNIQLTFRETYAAAAITGLLSGGSYTSAPQLVKVAWEIADLMCKEGAKHD